MRCLKLQIINRNQSLIGILSFQHNLRLQSLKYVFLLISALLLGCSEKKPITTEFSVLEAPKLVKDSETARRSDALRSLIIGQLQVKKEQHDKALQNFTHARELMGAAPAPLYKQIAELLVRDGKLDAALAEIDKGLLVSSGDRDLRIFKAGILEALKRYEESENLLKIVLNEEPNNSSVAVLLASLLINQGRASEAVAQLKQFSKNHGDALIVQVYLARTLESIGSVDEAISVLQKAVSKNPDQNATRFEYARMLLLHNKTERSKPELEEVLERDPSHIGARKLLGLLSLQQKDLSEARTHFETLEGIESDPTETRFHLSLIEIEEKKFEDALRELSLVLAARPDHAEARYALASVLLTTGRVKEALSELDKIPEQNSLYARARAVKFSIFQNEGKLSEAESEIRKAYDSGEESQTYSIPLIGVLRAQGKFSEALQVLEDEVSKDDTNTQILFLYGLTLEEADRHEEAIELMKKVISSDPTNSDALNFVAYSMIEKGGDLEQAEKYILKALEYRPIDPYYLDTLGRLRFKQNRADEAVGILERAIDRAPNEIDLWDHLGDAYWVIGEAQKAKDAWTKALDLLKQSKSSNANPQDIEILNRKIFGAQ